MKTTLNITLSHSLAVGVFALQFGCARLEAADQSDAASGWKPLFNSKDLTGWDKYLGPPGGDSTPLGLNNDPHGVFTVVEVDGVPAIRISGEIFGAITTKEEFDNFHISVV